MPLARLVSACALVIGLAHCSGDEKKRRAPSDDAGAAGETGSGGRPATGGGVGSDTGGVGPTADAATGGVGPTADAATGGEEPQGAGGRDGGAGGQNASGSGGGGGACGSPAPPDNCCQATDADCAPGWCGGEEGVTYFCCDRAQGVRRSCSGDIEGLVYNDFQVCVDPCTGRGYGTGSCATCIRDHPECSVEECDEFGLGFCQDSTAGYVRSCYDNGGNPDYNLDCLCDPSLN